MKLTMLGTGNALATKCYNTCFILEDNGQLLLVDGGGGNTVLLQIAKAGYRWQDIRHIFVTHKHIDHLLGVVWMVRMITQHMAQGAYNGDACLYGHEEVIGLIKELAEKLLPKKQAMYLGTRLRTVTVHDGQELCVIGNRFTAFDIHSDKAKQFGFCMTYGQGRRLVCCGDEPCPEHAFGYVQGCDWLLHEAFCLRSQADIFSPYEKHHSTVADACRLAQQLEVQNLLLYHTEDQNLPSRKALYCAEGQQYFSGHIAVPEDLEVIDL